ncbi:MAG: hypothetical protein M1834_002625 [Cirrosporium novae-zelandiae]|nr:MAG: hypothetical protein M1834_002625 [Cirrosporium novae-zelandiae]
MGRRAKLPEKKDNASLPSRRPISFPEDNITFPKNDLTSNFTPVNGFEGKKLHIYESREAMFTAATPGLNNASDTSQKRKTPIKTTLISSKKRLVGSDQKSQSNRRNVAEKKQKTVDEPSSGMTSTKPHISKRYVDPIEKSRGNDGMITQASDFELNPTTKQKLAIFRYHEPVETFMNNCTFESRRKGDQFEHKLPAQLWEDGRFTRPPRISSSYTATLGDLTPRGFEKAIPEVWPVPNTVDINRTKFSMRSNREPRHDTDFDSELAWQEEANTKLDKYKQPSLVDQCDVVANFRNAELNLQEYTMISISDDEYPMDEDAIEEAAQLAVVKEAFTPPSNLQFPLDDNSQTNETYDCNLFGSPPPSSVGETSERNQHKSTYSSPVHLINRHILNSTNSAYTIDDSTPSSCIDEDWSFVRDALSELEATDLAKPSPLRVSSPILPVVVDKPSRSGLKSTKSLGLKADSSIAVDPLLKSVANPRSKALIPITRPRFPQPLKDRSPIIGVNPSIVLRTCFRIGDAINAASSCQKIPTNCLIELYALVTFSSVITSPGPWVQHFQFADLFHPHRPPFMNGMWEGWRGSALWEADGKTFLGGRTTGKICRAVGKLERELACRRWVLRIKSIWEAGWDDVEYARRVVDE